MNNLLCQLYDKNKADTKIELSKYTSIKGIHLHIFVFNTLKDLGVKNITYYDISSVIKYDKNIRDTLYIYLSTAEEYIKGYLCNNYDLKKDKEIFDNYGRLRTNFDIKNDVFKVVNNESSFLFKRMRANLSALKNIFTVLDINPYSYDKHKLSQSFSQVIKLRNLVMHHSFLLIPSMCENINISDHLTNIRLMITSLSNLLPGEYRVNFINKINSLNYNSEKEMYSKHIYLENIGVE